MYKTAALGFRAHSGWTAAVAIAGPAAQPILLARRRIEIADPALPGSMQPYHAGEPLDILQAETWISQCRDSSTQLALRAVKAMIDELKQEGHVVVGIGVLFASGRPLPDLPAILRSHPMLHTAEGEFFRDVLVRAGEHCALPVTKVKEREAWDRGATALGLSAADLQQRIGELGKSIVRLSVLPVDHELALQSADLCMHAKTHGLSLGDRLCLAGARSYRLPVLTTDSEWGKVRLRGVTVRLIRGKATRA